MTTPSFERKTAGWLELGPNGVPVEAVEFVLSEIATTPQDRPWTGTTGWRRLPQRIRNNRRGAFTLAVAASVVIAVAGAMVTGLSTKEAVGSSPRPSPSLPNDPTDLLAGAPIQPLALSKAADGVVGAIPSSTGTIRVDLGRVHLDEPSVVAATCSGGGGLLLQMAVPGEAGRFVDLIVNCDGRVVRQQVFSVPGTPGVAAPSGAPSLAAGQDVWITVTTGASWRVAIAEYLPTLTARPTWVPIAGTPGWTRLAERAAFRFGESVGSDIIIPAEASRVGIFVECLGVGETSVGISSASARTTVSCPTTGQQRIEFDVTGGARLLVDAAVSDPLWVRWVVEVDGELGMTFPSAQPLPAAVSGTSYAVANGQYLTLGTIGGTRHTAIDVPGVQAGLPSGDLVTVTSGYNADFNAIQVDLWSIAEARVVRTLVVVESPASVFGSWLDATHQQAFYAVRPDQGSVTELRRIGLDGTGETVLETFTGQFGTPAMELAPDDGFFLLETCTETGACTRRVFDAATLEARTIPVVGEETCRVVRVLDEDRVVAITAPRCGVENPVWKLVTMAMDGSDRIELAAIKPGDENAWLVRSAQGPKVVHVTHSGDGTQELRSIDVATGAATVLWTNDGRQPSMGLAMVPLPEDWLLLGSIGSDPGQPVGSQPVPLLINVVTGEQIPMVNLPH